MFGLLILLLPAHSGICILTEALKQSFPEVRWTVKTWGDDSDEDTRGIEMTVIFMSGEDSME